MQPNLILPEGTQVVERSSKKTGVITKSPTDGSHKYEIQFPDRSKMILKRIEFSIRKHDQKVVPLLEDYELKPYVIYQCVVGSKAYGLADEDSDTDIRGIYLPPARLHWSIYGIPEQIEDKENDECYWEIQKFMNLALKANPNILECLYSPQILTQYPSAKKLLKNKQIFLSKLIYQTYSGYSLSQFKKMEQDLRTNGTIRWKHAMHLIRLLISGIQALKTGFIPVNMEEYRERLLRIKYTQMPWEEIDEWRLTLHKNFEDIFQRTKLPDRPDYEAANKLLIEARRFMING